jgi:hypothetical protein
MSILLHLLFESLRDVTRLVGSLIDQLPLHPNLVIDQGFCLLFQ